MPQEGSPALPDSTSPDSEPPPPLPELRPIPALEIDTTSAYSTAYRAEEAEEEEEPEEIHGHSSQRFYTGDNEEQRPNSDRGPTGELATAEPDHNLRPPSNNRTDNNSKDNSSVQNRTSAPPTHSTHQPLPTDASSHQAPQINVDNPNTRAAPPPLTRPVVFVSEQPSNRGTTGGTHSRVHMPPQPTPLNLANLPDTDGSQDAQHKPNYQYRDLARAAFLGTPTAELTVREIAEAICATFPFYANIGARKINQGVRRALQQNEQLFVELDKRVPNKSGPPGSVWALKPQSANDDHGVGRKRKRVDSESHTSDAGNIGHDTESEVNEETINQFMEEMLQADNDDHSNRGSTDFETPPSSRPSTSQSNYHPPFPLGAMGRRSSEATGTRGTHDVIAGGRERGRARSVSYANEIAQAGPSGSPYEFERRGRNHAPMPASMVRRGTSSSGSNRVNASRLSIYDLLDGYNPSYQDDSPQGSSSWSSHDGHESLTSYPGPPSVGPRDEALAPSQVEYSGASYASAPSHRRGVGQRGTNTEARQRLPMLPPLTIPRSSEAASQHQSRERPTIPSFLARPRAGETMTSSVPTCPDEEIDYGDLLYTTETAAPESSRNAAVDSGRQDELEDTTLSSSASEGPESLVSSNGHRREHGRVIHSRTYRDVAPDPLPALPQTYEQTRSRIPGRQRLGESNSDTETSSIWGPWQVAVRMGEGGLRQTEYSGSGDDGEGQVRVREASHSGPATSGGGGGGGGAETSTLRLGGPWQYQNINVAGERVAMPGSPVHQDASRPEVESGGNVETPGTSNQVRLPSVSELMRAIGR
ncbi:hypothetical protein SISNIDRAFT_506009 [Sistotremastrum niveocremeum HHB9708]|uniref:Fork-head domain-containing protein n=1 Tax=Sistotremastrum niveocremeum HHB9708 TaxID=1314777 RepID=A0A164V0W5_9AGAM|nr:hypothetical protein SISNIDRAFT_506009 [Sistotremastrum niveocremeum HHB9708]